MWPARVGDDGTLAVEVGQDDSAGAQDRAEVVRRELLLLDPVVRADLRRVRVLLHPDFVEFGASGRIWAAATIAEAVSASDLTLGKGAAVDLIPVSLSADSILLIYRIDSKDRRSLRSSVWLRDTAGEWRLRFHQGTLAPDPGQLGVRSTGSSS